MKKTPRRSGGWLGAIIARGRRWVDGELGPRASGRHWFGRRNERLAARHLGWRGYRIVARNFHAAGAEIDLIAMEGETLVFIEVKARRTMAAGTPEAAVDYRKQMRIRRAAEVYASRFRAGGAPIRFDVVAITGEGRKRKFEIVRDAF